MGPSSGLAWSGVSRRTSATAVVDHHESVRPQRTPFRHAGCALHGMRVSRTNVGLALAIFAGVIALGLAVWPVTPQSQLFGSGTWLILALTTSFGFLLAGFLSQTRHILSARAILLIGGIAYLVSGLVFGAFGRSVEVGLVAALADIVPGLLALTAAFTIGPVRQRAFP